MAIKLQTPAPLSNNIISIQYSRGKQDDGRGTIESIGSASWDFPGLGLGMKKVSSMGGKTADFGDETVTTAEFIGKSYILDTMNIVLYKRGIGKESTYIAEKDVVIPTASFTFDGIGGGTFDFGQKTIKIAVQRKESVGNDGIFGREEWASNPCEPSSVSYDCQAVFDYIKSKVPSITGDVQKGKCNAEGTARSVLSTISPGWLYGLSGECPAPPVDGCNVYSSKKGQTSEGAFSVSVWTYQRIAGATRTGRATVTIYEIAETSPQKHPDYPSDDDFIDEMVPARRKYQAISDVQGGKNTKGILEEFGVNLKENFTGIFAKEWSAVITFGTVDIWDFIKTFGIKYEVLIDVSGGLGLGWGRTNPFWINIIASGFERTFRQECFAQMGADQAADSEIFIWGGWQVDEVKSRVQKNAELFYPAPALNKKIFDINADETVFRSKTTNVTVTPSPERRSLEDSNNGRNNDGNNESGRSNAGTEFVTPGVWRSVQTSLIEGSEYRVGLRGNDKQGADSKVWDATFSTSMKEVSPEILIYILDGKANYHRKIGDMRNLVNSGYKIYAIGPPAGEINASCGGGSRPPGMGGRASNINLNDLSAIAGDLDESQLTEAEAGGDGEALVDDDASDWDDPCEDLVQIATDDADTTGKPLVFGEENKSKSSGLVSATGDICTADASLSTIELLPENTAASFSWVLPSLSNMRWTIKTEYQFSASVRGVTDATNEWKKSGPINGDENTVFSHTLNIVELPSPTSGPIDEAEVPIAGSDTEELEMSEFQMNGFFYPECVDLESLSASITGPEGLVVTYRLAEVRKQFGTKPKLIIPRMTTAQIRS